jgi:hypothetical protein
MFLKKLLLLDLANVGVAVPRKEGKGELINMFIEPLTTTWF